MHKQLLASIGAVVLLGASPPALSTRDIGALRAHVKHVFVIYQENRSFDSYFGSYPGADNLATKEARAHGFRQYDPLGNRWVTPFRVRDPDLSDANHARPALIAKADGGAMDRFVSAEETFGLARGRQRDEARRFGLVTMAFEDCDTVPFLWKYARSFALYDHFFQAMYGPSTPGNIDLIAAQTGLTQLARNPAQAVDPSDNGPGVPVVNDEEPAFGPYYGEVPAKTQVDQTYANVLLTLAGTSVVNARENASGIREDIAAIAKTGLPAVPWGWYQEGFGKGPGTATQAYIPHHNAPQYFGYVHQNAYFWNGVHDLTELLPAIKAGTLGDRSVVFVKGGYSNPFGWKPANPDPVVQSHFTGDDDHPGYSDSQISESMVATYVNAIARSKYWKDSAIFILWDDSEGYYDHVPPPKFERCPDAQPCGDGPRVPALLISPFARSGVVNSVSDHASFVKFLGRLFDLPALAKLPDEAPYMPMGPRDTNPRISDLTAAFDPQRLRGIKPPLPASVAEIPDDIVGTFPARMSCASLGMHPVSVPGSLTPPPGYAPR